MTYQSKYYDLDSFPKEERNLYTWILEKLETMPREELLALCDLPQIQLTFMGDDWQSTTPEEEIIGALISDFPPHILMEAIKSVEKRSPIRFLPEDAQTSKS